MRLLGLIIVFVAVPLSAFAAEMPPAEVIGVGAFIKMLGVLALLVGILYLFYAASRRGFGVLPGVKDGHIKLVETKPLGGRKFLCLVQVRGQEVLLGVSPERIERLHVLGEAPASFDQTLQQTEAQG